MDEPTIEVELQPASAPGYAAIVSLIGEHDVATQREIAEVLAAPDGNVLIDLSGCGFIDSAVLGALLGRAAALRRADRRLELFLPPANQALTRALDAMGIDRVLVVHDEHPTT
jgi:anti-anti-sigma factor